MAHAGKAILPVKSVGEFGKRIGVQVDGDSLTVGAYATKSDSGTRYSIVVMNTYVFKPIISTHSLPLPLPIPCSF